MNIKPEYLTEEHLEYLDDLRESGETNMFGARPYLLTVFPDLKPEEAAKIVVYWMETFSERHRNLSNFDVI
ncbi:MAG: hypothetical protein ACFFDN_09230 [Candidatus Hodarchaeota archaeon]